MTPEQWFQYEMELLEVERWLAPFKEQPKQMPVFKTPETHITPFRKAWTERGLAS